MTTLGHRVADCDSLPEVPPILHWQSETNRAMFTTVFSDNNHILSETDSNLVGIVLSMVGR